MPPKEFSVTDRVKSFGYAIAGIVQFIRQEHNAWIHVLATVSVAIAALILKVSRAESIALVFAVGMVWVAEMINTCMERMADLISKEEHPEIKFIKDLAAGAVLAAAITAAIIGSFIFIPKIV